MVDLANDQKLASFPIPPQVWVDTLDTLSKGSTSYNSTKHQDTIETERVPMDRSVSELNTIGTEGNWEEDYRDQG